MSDALTPKPRNPLPAEQPIWRGHPSQWTNLGSYLFILLGIVGIHFVLTHFYKAPYNAIHLVVSTHLFTFENLIVFSAILGMLAFALAGFVIFLSTALTTYELTNQRVLITTLNIDGLRRQEIELYRVFEYVLFKPFIWLPFGLGLIELRCNDPKQPYLYLRGIRNSEALLNHIRQNVEMIRDLIAELSASVAYLDAFPTFKSALIIT
jgi:hypothetical protein